MWHIEVDPVLRSPIVAIGVLERMPDWGTVLEIASSAVGAFPTLRCRVSGRRWVDVPDFDITDHVRRLRLATEGPVRALLDFVEPTVTAAFDVARPPWEWTFVDGLEGGRAGFAFRVHHALTDGVGGVGLAAALLFQATEAPAVPGAGREPEQPSLIEQLAGLPAGGLRLGASIARELAPAVAPLSPIMRGRGLRRALDTIDVPLERLHVAAQGLDVSLNDAFLGAVGGGLRSYHEAQGASAEALRFTMPVSIRLPTDPPGGNRFAPARFVLPLAGTPAERITSAARCARSARNEPALPLTAAVSALLDRLPPRVAATMVGSMFKSVDVDAVNVPGLAGSVSLAGAQVERLYAFAPPTGAAVSITLLSHGPTACIGIQSDRTAVADPALLTQCLTEAFGEVLDLASPRPTVVTA
jgi:WS/DGAT/MGAT family acyltransferase